MAKQAFLIACVCAALVCAPLESFSAASAVGKMTSRGAAEVNGTAAPAEISIFAGDRITTGEDTAAAVQFSGGHQVFLPEASAAVVKLQGALPAIALERGGLAVISRSVAAIAVFASGVKVVASAPGAIFEVALKRGGLRVTARRGTTLVRAADRTVEVKEGMTLDATTSSATAPNAGASSGLTTFQTVALIASVTLGITGFALGIAAINRSEPQDCTVTGTTTPFQITCP